MSQKKLNISTEIAVLLFRQIVQIRSTLPWVIHRRDIFFRRFLLFCRGIKLSRMRAALRDLLHDIDLIEHIDIEISVKGFDDHTVRSIFQEDRGAVRPVRDIDLVVEMDTVTRIDLLAWAMLVVFISTPRL